MIRYTSLFISLMFFLSFFSCKDDSIIDEILNTDKCEELSIVFQKNFDVPNNQNATSVLGTTVIELMDGRLALATHFTTNLHLLDENGATIWS